MLLFYFPAEMINNIILEFGETSDIFGDSLKCHQKLISLPKSDKQPRI